MSAFHVPVPPRAGHAAFVVCVGLLTAAAWLALVVFDEATHSVVHLDWGLSPGLPTVPMGGYLLLFLGGWTLMCVAMMLPTSLSVLATFRVLAAGRPNRRTLVALVVTGYLHGVGGVRAAGVRRASGAGAGEDGHRVGVGPAGSSALLVLAGAFQFSSRKYRCLDQCRSPLGFVLGYGQGRREKRQAFGLGFDHGVFCVGCCWALMLLMFLAGAHHVWMLGLGSVMAVEKNAPWGRRLSAPLGAVLIAAGLVVGVLRYLHPS
jgi:predicted metal-binding membrane protein